MLQGVEKRPKRRVDLSNPYIFINVVDKGESSLHFGTKKGEQKI